MEQLNSGQINLYHIYHEFHYIDYEFDYIDYTEKYLNFALADMRIEFVSLISLDCPDSGLQHLG